MSYAEVNCLSLYYEEHGSGEPLILLHGGISAGEMFAAILPELAAGRRVITVDLQGHGHTADADRPLRPQSMATPPTSSARCVLRAWPTTSPRSSSTSGSRAPT